ncbi:MAG: peptide deformylase [Planctomycetota bacterium]
MELRIYPDTVLKRKSRAIKEVTDEIVARAQEMLEFMYEADGLGLAAPQVGWSERIVTLDAELEKKGPRIFVNPIITAREGHQEEDEGCLSLPGLRVRIPRAAKVEVVAYTLAGDRVELEAEGLAARAWQHELDHLNGLLLIDRLSPTTLMSLRVLLKKLEQEAADRERQGT